MQSLSIWLYKGMGVVKHLVIDFLDRSKHTEVVSSHDGPARVLIP